MMIGIGCDIVKIERVRKAMQKEGFLIFLTSREKIICASMKDARKAEWIAGRFAAKEAIYKAIHSAYPCTIKDIEVLSDEDGAPCCSISNYDVEISIAHEVEYAIAYAIVSTKE